jgi:hypothetical protein
VHLYIDPETAYGPLPMLYADCEGLEGGDTAPIASRLRETMRNQGHPSVVRRRLFSSRPRELVYAKTNTDARNREWAVKQVYPRLLYTFSDVVVFVLRNPGMCHFFSGGEIGDRRMSSGPLSLLH